MLGINKQKPKEGAGLFVEVNTSVYQTIANDHLKNTLKGNSPAWAFNMVLRLEKWHFKCSLSRSV